MTVGTAGNQPPTITLGPDQTVTFSQTVTLHPVATDDGLPTGSGLSEELFQLDGPGDVSFLDGSTLDAATISFPAAGVYHLRATASDGQLSASADVKITVTPGQTQPPVVQLTAPASGSVYTHGQTVALSASATDPDGTVQSVAFYADGKLLGAGTTRDNSIWNYSWAGASLGSHTLAAYAVDNSGTATTSGSVTVTVGAAVPQVALSYPAAYSAFKAGDQVTLQASASPGGDGAAVTGVQFFVNGQSVGQATQAPYNAVWNVPAAGDYTLTATATDSAGQQATSAAVPVRAVDAGSDPGAPTTVDLASPTEGQEVTAPVAIVGTVDGPTLQSWKLEYRRRSAKCSDWTTFGVGTGVMDDSTARHVRPHAGAQWTLRPASDGGFRWRTHRRVQRQHRRGRRHEGGQVHRGVQ